MKSCITKKEFERYIKAVLKDATVDEKIETFKCIELWSEEMKKKALSKVLFCPECKRHSPEKKYLEVARKEVIEGYTYVDCGYGDGDLWGAKEYMVYYKVCPLCKREQEYDKTYLRTLWEKDREGNIVNR